MSAPATRALFVTAFVAFAAGAQSAPPASLGRAHAHNDYEHARPLFDALERGFNSIEADVYLVDGRLLVAHSRDSVRADRTLESLYLAPLREWVKQHGGRAIGGARPLTLLIDVKSDSEATYRVLDAQLREYASMFTRFTGGVAKEGPVVAIVSGNRAIGTMRSAHVRFAAVDGRIADLQDSRAPSAGVMPLVSDSWDRITKWNGDGPAPDSVRKAVEQIVQLAHKQGRQVRFWGTPDREALWRLLLDAGVDYIGADDLAALQRFLSSS